MTRKKARRQTKELLATPAPEETGDLAQLAAKRVIELTIEKAAREFVCKMIEWEYGLRRQNPPSC